METAVHDRLSPISVLIIDDSPSEQALLASKLRQMGHLTRSAFSGSEGIRELFDSERGYDLVLLDVLMPDMDGLETARRIRAMERDMGEEWRPIIFLSGRVSVDDVAAGIAAGGDDYLAKPVHTRVLHAKIQAMQRIADMRNRLLEFQGRLKLQAETDELTGLANRRHFLEELNRELARAKRHQTPLSLAYLDLDHFKRVNDRYGHKAGDDVLRAVAGAFRRALRDQDIMGRLGGEEFCICMPGVDLQGGRQACERFRDLVEQLSIHSDATTLRVTASLGVASLDPRLDDATRLMARADAAVYQAKQAGRNRVRWLTGEEAKSGAKVVHLGETRELGR
jgi:two-component system cell cycle response regulator